MPEEQKVTEEQAETALRDLFAQGEDPEPTSVEVEIPAEKKAEPAVPAAPAEEKPGETPAPEETPVAAKDEGDDVASLRKRLDEEKAGAEKRWRAMQERSAHNERILRERYLRKSSVADQALRILKATRTEQGVPEADVDRTIRELEGTMNPASPSYVPPDPRLTTHSEDQAMILNEFLNEQGMSDDDSTRFGEWIKADGPRALTPGEQSLAQRDLDAFLRVAHLRYQQASKPQTTRADAIEAVKAVQRTQREAAKAATATASAPRTTKAAAPAEVDLRKLTKDDISTLLKQSVEQYR